MTPSRRYFFVHMMKTGGTAFRERLVHCFGDELYPAPGLDGPDPYLAYFSTEQLLKQLAARGDRIRMITGHFPLRVTELIGGRIVTLTLLRDPVERALSSLRSEHRERPRPLDDAYAASHGLGNNYMTKMLTLTPQEMARTPYARTDLDLDRAKQALAGMDAVGLQERLEDFCDHLTSRFGWDLGEPKVVNASPRMEASASLRERIARDNLLDVQLYEYARELVAGRRQPPA